MFMSSLHVGQCVRTSGTNFFNAARFSFFLPLRQNDYHTKERQRSEALISSRTKNKLVILSTFME